VKRPPAAFTLVELLVVVAIMLVLLAILLPALNLATDRAKATTCLNNLHQIVAGTFAYAGDHSGLLPYGVQSESRGWRWESCLIPYLGLGSFTNGEGTTAPEAFALFTQVWYLNGNPQGVLKCPADDLIFRGPPGALKSYSGNSGMYYDGPIAYGERVPLSSVVSPGRTLLYDENWCGYTGMNWGRYMPLMPRSWGYCQFDISSATVRDQLREWFSVNIPIDFVNFKNIYYNWEPLDFCVPAGYPMHQGKWSVAFCDGSTRTMKVEDALWPVNLFSMGQKPVIP